MACSPDLEVAIGSQTYRLRPGQTWHLGGNTSCGVFIPEVGDTVCLSLRHAAVRMGAAVSIEPLVGRARRRRHAARALGTSAASRSRSRAPVRRPGDPAADPDPGQPRQRTDASVDRSPCTGATPQLHPARHQPGDGIHIETDLHRRPGPDVLAVVGPSGAGKSTLCRALLGEMEDTSGSASVDGVQLAHRGQPTHLVSFVPQPEAMALDLTVRQSLECVARLRLARDATAAELRARVDQVIHSLALHDQAGQRIGSLSGGQRKRVSVGMELLSEPRLLILDEPTSGLDEGLDRQMMDLLQDVAAAERAVIVVTHSTANLDRADRIVAVNGEGGLGFFGSPSGLLTAFAISSYAAVMDRLRKGESAASDLSCEPTPPPSGPLPPRLPQLRSRTRVLIGRELLRLRNRQGARQLSQHLLAAPVIVAALSALASSEGLAHDNADRTRVLSVLFICSAFFASALSFSSIVADQDMIMRETRWGIPATSVITSRAAILCAFGAVQGLLTAGLFSLTRPLYDGGVPMPAGHGPLPAWVTVATSLVLLDVACVSLGLLLSTVSSSLQQAVLGLMTSAVTQVVLSGTLISLGGDSAGRRALQAISVLVPTRWAVGALGADAGLNLPLGAPTPPQGPDPWWTHDTLHVLGGWIALAVLATGFLTAARQRLKARQLSRR